MLISQDRTIDSMLWTLEKLQQRKDVPQDVLYDAKGMSIMLRQLQHREVTDGAGFIEHCRKTIELLSDMHAVTVTEGNVVDVTRTVEGLIAQGNGLLSSGLQGAKFQQGFINFLRLVDQQFSRMTSLAPELSSALFSRFAERLLALHNSLDLLGHRVATSPSAAVVGDTLTEQNLTAYMRDRLADPTAVVTGLTVLAGGFGKETSLFTVKSKSFNADLVMRRDPPHNFFEGIDCHAIKEEFPLLKAVGELGFPVPETFWLEQSPSIIKGPDYIIVRKAAGRVEGDATGAGQGRVSEEIQRTLASVVARLHTLPPLMPLGHLGESHPVFRASLWHESMGACVHRYISDWYRFSMQADRLPAPAVHGLFNWMLAHIPQTEDRPTLVHGDIGLHNLLFDEGKLSAVLDWEFAHVGDPAEDLGYIRSMMASQLDWPVFLVEYEKAGGRIPSEERILFYEIWAFVRNAAASNIVAESFENGSILNARYGLIPYHFVAHYFARAQTLIAEWGKH